MSKINNESAEAEEPPRKISKRAGSTASKSKPSLQKDMVEQLAKQEAKAKKAKTEKHAKLAKITIAIEVIKSTISKDAVS